VAYKDHVSEIVDISAEERAAFMEDIARAADRVMVMSKGRLEMFDTPKKVFACADKLESIGLRVPEITKIMLTLKDKGYDVSDSILTVEQAFTEVVSLLKKEGKL
jgi:energy-coupling factor transport system ATP-binding protein